MRFLDVLFDLLFGFFEGFRNIFFAGQDVDGAGQEGLHRFETVFEEPVIEAGRIAFRNEEEYRLVRMAVAVHELFVGQGGHHIFFIPQGISFFDFTGNRRHHPDGGFTGIEGVSGRVGTEEVVLSRRSFHFRCQVDGGAAGEIVGQAFHHEAEEHRGRYGGDYSEPPAAAFFIAKNQGPEGIENHRIKDPPASFLDVDGTADGGSEEKGKAQGRPQVGLFLSLPDGGCCQGGKDDGRHHGNVGVGDVLGGHESVEQEGAPAPYHEETVERGLFLPAPDHFIKRSEGPGEKSGRKKNQVVVPVVVFGVLGRRSSQDIVKAQELFYEIIAMNEVHAAVPGEGDGKKGKNALPGKKAGCHFPRFHGETPQKEQGAGKHQSHGALGQAGKAGGGIGQHQVFPVSLHHTDIAGKHGGNSEEKEDAVSNDGMGNDPEFQRQGQHGAGPYGSHIILPNPLHVPDEKGHRQGA